MSIPSDVTIIDHQLRVRDMNVSMGQGFSESEQWVQGPGGPWVGSLTVRVGINQWSGWQAFLDSLRGTGLPFTIDPDDLDTAYTAPVGSFTVKQAHDQYSSRVVIGGPGWAVSNMFTLGGYLYRIVSIAEYPERVANGGFEAGLTGWTITSDAPAPDPSYDAGVVTIDRQGGDNPAISQAVTLAPGSTYQISAGMVAGTMFVRNGGASGAIIATLSTGTPSVSVTGVTATSLFLTDSNTGSGAGNRVELTSFSVLDQTTTDQDVTIVPRLRAAAAASDAISASTLQVKLAARDTGRIQKPASGAADASLEFVEYF